MKTANEIPVGMLVRSFDFQGNTDHYVEGVLVKVGPAPEAVCPCGGDHIHIRVTRVVRDNVDVTETALRGVPADKRYVYPALNWNNVEPATLN